MLNLPLAQIASIVSGRLIGSGEAIANSAVSDSRQAAPGLIFVALRGEQVDGHSFAGAALSQGAAAVMVEEPQAGLEPQIVVADCRKALAELACFQLRRYPVKIVAITGSMGKTSSKNLIAAVLSMRFKVLKNEGNRNTEVTLPMTLFELEADHQVAVLEMGMNARGEISELCAIAPPDIAMISNIHEVHLERLGSIEAIAATKGEIFDALNESGVAMVNNDDSRVVTEAEGIKAHRVSYGIKHNSDLMAAEIQSLGLAGSRFTVTFPDGREQRMTLPLPGEHMVQNALPAALAGYLFGLSPEEIATGLASVTPAEQRLEVREIARQGLLIDDSYNSNPHSVAAALNLVAELRADRPVFIALGDMLELGEVSLAAHRQVGRMIAELNPECLITRGILAEEIGNEAKRLGYAPDKVYHQQDNLSALAKLQQMFTPNALILVKGSRGMRMEEIVRGLEAM